MRDCYQADSRVILSWFDGSGAEFVSQSEVMAGRGARPTHQVAAPVVRVHGTRAVVEAPVSIAIRFEIDVTEVELVSAVRLLYRAELRDAGWKIASLTAIYERDSLTPVVPGAPVTLDLDALARYREPYRFLAFHLSLSGATAHDDMYGDDRPEEVAELYRETFAWLRAGH